MCITPVICELCSHEIDWPFAVVNFLELIGESMGITREDQFKRLKKMQDTDAILAEVTDLVAQHGLSLEEFRAVIEKDLLGDQQLALKRSEWRAIRHPHPADHRLRSRHMMQTVSGFRRALLLGLIVLAPGCATNTITGRSQFMLVSEEAAVNRARCRPTPT